MNLEAKLIRWVMEFSAANCGNGELGFVNVPDHPSYCPKTVHYHVGICDEAGYIETTDLTVHDYPYKRYGICRVTLEGHRFLAKKGKAQIGFLLACPVP